MTNNLLDISGKVDGLTVQVFEEIYKCSDAINIPFFVIGATARDMILTLGHDVQVMRATQDIDFGVQVPSWELYEKLIQKMLSTGDFTKNRMAQRLVYKGQRLVDIVPFGSISNSDNTVIWPSPHDSKMSIIGFEDAYRHRQIIRVRSQPKLEIPFASLMGLVVLKLISWNDNSLNRKKDAQDVAVILRHYIDAGNLERLYEEHADIFEIDGMDYLSASARLLGRDIASMSSPETKSILLQILNKETSEAGAYKFLAAMNLGFPSEENRTEEDLRLLEELIAGINDGA